MYSTILVGLDGSPREAEVFAAATALAEQLAAKLHACRAVAIPVGLPDAVWALGSGDLGAALIADAEHGVAKRIAAAAISIAGRHVRIGQPADVVLDVADEIGADLIVIGAHGYGALERLIGTTASKIVHRSKCSVLVSRSPATP